MVMCLGLNSFLWTISSAPFSRSGSWTEDAGRAEIFGSAVSGTPELEPDVLIELESVELRPLEFLCETSGVDIGWRRCVYVSGILLVTTSSWDVLCEA